MKKYVFLLFLSLNFNLLLATNYYLDPINGSMSNVGSSEHPWGTLSQVLSTKTIADGDTLFLRSGFHGVGFGINGVQNSKTVIMAEPGHKPILFKVNINGTNWVLDGIIFTPEGNRGHEIRTGNDNGKLLLCTTTSSNNTIKNCEFYSAKNTKSWSIQNWRDSVWSGYFDYGSNNTIKNSKVKNVAYALTAMEQSGNAIFDNNIVEIYSGDGIRCAGADNLIIQNNIVRNAVELDPDPFVNNHEDGIQGWGTIVGLIVRGNLVYSDTAIDSIPFIGPIQGIVIFDGTTTDALFENNVVITEHWHGLTVLGSYNSKYINNTILPVPGVVTSQGPPWLRVDKTKDGVASSGNIVRNNLVTDMVIESGSSIVDHNVIDLSSDLFCADYDNWDFTPKQGFTLNGKVIIDAGSSIDAPNIDINGDERPQGNGIDIGAYESSFTMDPPPDDLLTSFSEDFNGEVDTTFWAFNWTAGEITADRENDSFTYTTDSLNNYFLGVILDFQNSKSVYLDLTANPYLTFRAKVNGVAMISGVEVDSIPIGLDLINPAGDNIGGYYAKTTIASNGEWFECKYDFTELVNTVGVDSVAKIRFNPGKERFDGFVYYSGSVTIDDFKIGQATTQGADPGEPILFNSIPKLTDKFYSTWKVKPTHKPMDGVTGFAKGEVSTFTNMGILVRFKDNIIDAYNGSGYEAENFLEYEADKEYTIKVIADIKAQLYSVDVIPEGTTEPIRIGTNFVFRSVNRQDTLGYFAMVINELEAFGGVRGSRLNPSFVNDDYEINFVNSSSIEPQTAVFTSTFNIKPTAQRLNSAIALSNSSVIMDGWGDLSAIVRLTDQNKFDVRDGGEYRADTDLEYVAETNYTITCDVNIIEQKYSVNITPDGGAVVNLATDYNFRASADTLTTLSQLTIVGGMFGGNIGEVFLTGNTITDIILNDSSLPLDYSLEQNFPNPFNPSTVIKYSIPNLTNVTISIFNSLGQRVNTLVNKKQGVGNYKVNWNGTDQSGNNVSTGVYFYQINAGEFIQTRKMLLIK